MPTYDYRIEATGEVIEVRHTMALTPKTWEELCLLGNLQAQDIPPESPVTKLLTAAGVVKSSTLKNPEAPPCMSGGGCPGGGCGI
ncbi:zinc ribbon domain-containing protein [Neptuniibacter halophilus]|uniref:zinc ribbon domain-containing protein n=1 Tax=Neptuniibacter halophilus TaxID=651666 RepID=UPI0025723C9D|nr:zinc ribbon domain-containing protein [Neptuniibacter halophilus]